jgi:surface polysaccharide O-acyltransferase-like enzyme
MKRNLELDLLKIIACFTVIVVHVTGIIATNNSNIYTINHTLYYIGSFSIQMFFMVNGFFSLNKKNISYQYVIKKI